MQGTKTEVVADLKEQVSKVKTGILVDFTGLSAPEMGQLRRHLKENNAELKVVKNTLFKRAVEGTPFSSLKDRLTGPNGVILTHADPSVFMKSLVNFMRSYPHLTVKSGTLDGRLLTSEEIIGLSLLPDKQVLLAYFLSTLCIPHRLVWTLNNVLRNFLTLLTTIKEQKCNKITHISL